MSSRGQKDLRPLAPSAKPGSRFHDLADVGRMGLVDFVIDRSRLGDVFALEFGSMRPVVLTHPDHLHHVLVDRRDNYPKGESVRNFRIIVGNGLFTADGEAWRAHRAILQPHFRKVAVEGYGPQMTLAVRACVARWESRVGQPIDMLDEMMDLALDVVGQSMFSKPIAGGRYDLARHYKRALEEIGDREHSITLPMWVPTPSNVRLRFHKWHIDRYIRSAMAERRAEATARGDLLDALLSAGAAHVKGGLSDQQILDELATLLIAGHETSALTMAWAFWFLAKHPDVEARALAELARVVGDRDVTLEDLGELRYLRAIVDECLRLYPPVWINPRIAIADDEIGGYRIPAGTMVLIGAYFTHRRPELWANPDAFDPDRFMQKPTPNRFEFLPFGAGGRTCAGLAFAYQEILLALATLLPRFAIRPENDAIPKVRAIGTLQPEHMPMKLMLR